MKKHFYAIWVNYLPNSAPSIRMLAYLQAWSKLDLEVTVVFLLPDRAFSKVQECYSNIQFIYLWEKIPIRSRLVDYLFYGCLVKSLVKMLKDNDRVYVYSQANLLQALLNKKGVLVFHETTEHPSAIPLGVKFHFTSLENYMNCCRQLKGLFVISSQLQDFFISNGVKKDNVRIINMVVDPSRFDGVQKQDVKQYIAYCGNASNKKDGVDVLIESFAQISKKYDDIRLLIIGKAPDSNEENRNILFSNELGLREKVVFTGTVTYKEMPQLLKNACILTLARPDSIQAKFGFPTKLGEYLLTANPVVITDTGDVSKFLTDKESAMIAKPDDVEDFSKKMEWLLEHREEAQIIGNNGRQVALKNFNVDIEARKIVDFMFNQHSN